MDTNVVLKLLSPKNHAHLLNNSREEIKKKSKNLMTKLCDKDNHFYNKQANQNSVVFNFANTQQKKKIDKMK